MTILRAMRGARRHLGGGHGHKVRRAKIGERIPVDGTKPDFHAYHSTFSPPYSRRVGRNAIFAVVGLGIGVPWAINRYQQKKNGYIK